MRVAMEIKLALLVFNVNSAANIVFARRKKTAIGSGFFCRYGLLRGEPRPFDYCAYVMNAGDI